MSDGLEQARVHAKRALAALALRRYTEAEQEAVAALSAAPHWAYGHYLLAHALSGQERHGGALQQALEAVSLDPGRAEFHAYLSFAQSSAGHPCTDAMVEAVRLAPDEGRYVAALAWRRARDHEPEQAEALLQRALSLDPGDPAITLQAARTYAVLHRADRTRELCLATMALGGDQSSAQELLASLDERAGDFAQSAQAAQESLRSDPNDGAMIASYARSLVELGRLSEASELLAYAEQTDPWSHALRIARQRWQARASSTAGAQLGVCPHESLKVRNPYETVRVFVCHGCKLSLVCECEFEFARRCLHFQASHTDMELDELGGIVTQHVCPTCRGQPEPLAEKLHGSFIERVYWRELFRRTEEKLLERIGAARRDGVVLTESTPYEWRRQIEKEEKAILLAEHKATPRYSVPGDPYHRPAPPPKPARKRATRATKPTR